MQKNQFNYSWSWINWLPDHYFRFSEERLTFETRDLSDILQIYFLSTIDHPLISLNLYFRFPSFPSRIISNPAHAVTVWKTHITFSYHQGSLPIWLKFIFPFSMISIKDNRQSCYLSRFTIYFLFITRGPLVWLSFFHNFHSASKCVLQIPV